MATDTRDVKQENGLKLALEALETAVETPVISGELANWVDTLDKAWREANVEIKRSVGELHPRQYEEMGQADLEMLPRIEQLMAEDQAIANQCDAVDQHIRRAVEHVPKLEPDEAKAQRHLASLIDETLAFIIRVRKQEVAVETWFVESFNRDRGAVD